MEVEVTQTCRKGEGGMGARGEHGHGCELDEPAAIGPAIFCLHLPVTVVASRITGTAWVLPAAFAEV